MEKKVYSDLLSSLDFLPNSPTLFNMGTGRGTLSACFKFDIQDSMESIIDVGSKALRVMKWGGGVGFVLSNLRAKGEPVSTTHGKAMGPVSVLRWLHAGARMVTQGGKRAGAQMGILHVEHPDLYEFIHCKNEDPQSLSTFNISVALTDTFMEEASEGGAALTVLNDMAVSAWRTGDPGCFFIDAAERANPTPEIGQLTGVNPCGEVPLLDNEACNLGSINLSHFVADGFDWERLGATVRLAVRYLDEVIDVNTFPDQVITDAVATTRKLGLGVMGWADALALLHIHYDTDEAVNLGAEVMAFINEEAYDESMELAARKGSCPALRDGPRNSTRTCIAPTGTIALIAGCSSGIEPHFSDKWERIMGDGTVLTEEIGFAGFTPKVSHDISAKWHLAHQAAFQQSTDLAVSKTINLPERATSQDILEVYLEAWRLGLTGVTVYRDKSRSEQVLNVGVNGKTSTNCPECGFMLQYGEGCETCVQCGYSACSV